MTRHTSIALFTSFVVAAGLSAAWSKADEPEKSLADPMLGKEAGQVRDDNGLKMKLVWCPQGVFTLGPRLLDESVRAPGAETAHMKVVLTTGFWLGKYEVTQAEWTRLMATEPWKGQDCTKEGDDYPATFVSWHEAVEFCRRLTRQERTANRLHEDWEYTLPTEAQWERACRAGTDSLFSFGDDETRIGDYGWFRGNASKAGDSFAHRVGRKQPNPWGLFDMHGNVTEWCRDVYTEVLPVRRDPAETPNDESSPAGRVHRGGGWTSFAEWCQSGFRNWSSASVKGDTLGFRVALTPVRPAK